MAQFPYLITVDSSAPPTPAAREAITAVLAEHGFTDVQEVDEAKLRVSGSSPARADQLAFTLRDKLCEIWKSTTVLVSEPQKQGEE